MSTNAVTKCDECDAEKREVNNWKSMVGQPERPAFYTFEEANLITAPDGDEVRRDYCGHKCASSAFNRWLDTGSVLPTVKTEVADAAQGE